jgi:uncharacterized protein DUF4124/Big-like domain-containing protein
MRTAHHALVTLCLLTLGGVSAAATLYRWVDAQGVVHYSDTPQPGAEVLHVSGAQTYHGTTTPDAAPVAAATTPKAAEPYKSCDITQPAADSSLFAPEEVTVSVQVSPGLRGGDQLSVQVDGQTLQPTSDGSLSFQLAAPERGEHTVSAQVHSADGAVLCSATSISFSVQRPSVNSPASPVKPH